MDTTRFDQLTSALASASTRRQALRSFAGIASAAVVATTLGGESGEARRKGGGKGKGKGKGKGGGKGGGNHGGGGGGSKPPVTRPADMCPISAQYNAPVCGSEPGGIECSCHRAVEGNNFCGGQVDTCASLRPCNSTQDCRDSVGFHYVCQAATGGACGQVCVPVCENINPF